VFPFVVESPFEAGAQPEALAWISAHRDELLRLSLTHGAVLFRGFPLPSVEAFDGLIQALGVSNFPYGESLSNAVRVNRTERVFSANEAPPEVRIFFHHEMAQTPVFPARILFYCEVAAEQGGATPTCRSDVLYEQLKERCPAFIRECETKGLRYTNVMPGSDDPNSGMGRSWQSTLGTDSRSGAEKRLGELGYSWAWLNDGCLKATTPPLPAVMEVSPGRKTFFNQLIAAYCGWKDERNDPSQAVRHGDGSVLDAGAVTVAGEIADELTFNVAWRPGDTVLIDNAVVMHARQPFRGTRKVVASLADKRTQSFPKAPG
jgi:hypothetical protein